MTTTKDNTTTSVGTKARKGDLVLVEQVSRNYWSVAAVQEAKAAGRKLPETETSYQFGVVDSATRDGVIKTWREVGYGDDLLTGGRALPFLTFDSFVRCWVLSAKKVDVDAVLRAAKAHHWPGHPGQPKPFDSFDEAQQIALAAARPVNPGGGPA